MIMLTPAAIKAVTEATSMKKSDLALEKSGAILTEKRKRIPSHVMKSVVILDADHIRGIGLACQKLETVYSPNVLRIALYFNDDILFKFIKRLAVEENKRWFSSVFFLNILKAELDRVITEGR